MLQLTAMSSTLEVVFKDMGYRERLAIATRKLTQVDINTVSKSSLLKRLSLFDCFTPVCPPPLPPCPPRRRVWNGGFSHCDEGGRNRRSIRRRTVRHGHRTCVPLLLRWLSDGMTVVWPGRAAGITTGGRKKGCAAAGGGGGLFESPNGEGLGWSGKGAPVTGQSKEALVMTHHVSKKTHPQ